jgi:hypothetical protein
LIPVEMSGVGAWAAKVLGEKDNVTRNDMLGA